MLLLFWKAAAHGSCVDFSLLLWLDASAQFIGDNCSVFHLLSDNKWSAQQRDPIAKKSKQNIARFSSNLLFNQYS